MSKVAEIVLWLLVLTVAALGIWAGYGMFRAVNIGAAEKAVTSQCATPGAASLCLEGVAQLDNIRSSAWLCAAGAAFAAIGAAFGLGLLIVTISASDSPRAGRERPQLLVTSLSVVAISAALFAATMIARSM